MINYYCIIIKNKITWLEFLKSLSRNANLIFDYIYGFSVLRYLIINHILNFTNPSIVI